MTLGFHDRIAKLWREARARCLRDLEALSDANDGFVEDALALLSLADVHIGFARRTLAQKRTALELLVSNASRAIGRLAA